MYYDKFNNQTVSDAEIASLNLASATRERLAELGFYRLEILRPEIPNQETMGLRPAGEPYPSPDDPFAFIQQMEAYSFLDELKKTALETVSQRRKSAQCANFIMDDGVIFKTAPEDRMQIAALAQSMREKGKLEVDFKAASGWITASIAYIKTVNDRITEYIEACFSNERRLADAIMAAASLDELNAVDSESGWPGNAPAHLVPKQDAQDDSASPDNRNNQDNPASPDISGNFDSPDDSQPSPEKDAGDESILRERLQALAAQKADEARILADAVVVPYMADFSDVEKQTWTKQQAEVAAYLADNSSKTPTLDGLAEARGISRETMLEKAIARVTAFEPLSVAIVGRQQAYEDAIRAIADDETRPLDDRIAALREMKIDYSLDTENGSTSEGDFAPDAKNDNISEAQNTPETKAGTSAQNTSEAKAGNIPDAEYASVLDGSAPEVA